jgi:hypothetical protein
MKLYAVAWNLRKSEARIVSVDAVEKPMSYLIDLTQMAGYDDKNAVSYRSIVTKGEREKLCIGLSPKEALDLHERRLLLEMQELQEKLEQNTCELSVLVQLTRATEGAEQ